MTAVVELKVNHDQQPVTALPRSMETVLGGQFPVTARLFTELAVVDTITAMHSAIAVDARDHLFHQLVALIPGLDAAQRRWLEARHRRAQAGTATHDIGKVGIASTIPEAVAIVNSRSKPGAVLSLNGDHRHADDQARHLAHPPIGMFMLADLAQDEPEIGPPWLAAALYHDTPFTAVFPKRRVGFSIEKTKTHLYQDMVGHEPAQTALMVDLSLHTMNYLTANYSHEKCLNPGVLTLSGRPLNYNQTQTPLLESLVAKTWQKHGAAIMRQIEAFSPW